MNTSYHRDSAMPQHVNNSFDEGRFDKPYSGGDRNEYMRGKAEKDQWTKATGSNNPSSTTRGSVTGDPGAGNFWGKLILFGVTILVAVPSFFTAILAGTILLLVFKSMSPGMQGEQFRFYSAAFWSMFAYLATAAVVSLALPFVDPAYLGIQGLTYIQTTFLYFFAITDPEIITGVTLLKFHLPCILVAAIVFNIKMKEQLGRLRFLKSLTLVAIVLLPSFVGLLHLMQALLPSQLNYFMKLV